MPKKIFKPSLDEQLAIFTDQLLDGDWGQGLFASEEAELGGLQNTVRWMVEAQALPMPELVVGQMRKELAAEWQAANPRRKSLRRQVSGSAKSWTVHLGGKRFAFALASTGLVLALFLSFSRPGAAISILADDSYLVLAALLVCAGLGSLLFASLRKGN